MRLSPVGLALVQRFEGFSATVYLDAARLPTIGYGHLLTRLDSFPNGISQQEAFALLGVDVRSAEAAVMRWITSPLTQSQFDALVSFTFNLGAGALQRSTLRRVINRGCYHEAPPQLMRYVWAGGRRLEGLVRRRKAEAALFLSQ